MKFRVLVVDDEAMARKRLRRFMESARDLELVGECSHGKEAIEVIRQQPPDLVFLDVQMPEMDGFQVIENIGVERMPVVIFVTAHDEHALRAFAAQAVDYLLKPFGEDRFEQALQRARRYLQGRDALALQRQLSGLLEEVTSKVRPPSRLAVKSDGRVLFLRVEEIDWVEAMGDYAKLHVGGESHLLRVRMNELEKKLATGRFFRLHRSTLVNLDRIKEFRPLFQGELVVVLTSGQRLTASRACAQKLQQALERRPESSILK